MTDIGHLFSTGRPDALDAVKKLIDEKQTLKNELAEFQKAELFNQIDTTDDDTVFTKITDRNILNSAFNHFKEVHDGACFIFSEKGDGSYTFLAGPVTLNGSLSGITPAGEHQKRGKQNE